MADQSITITPAAPTATTPAPGFKSSEFLATIAAIVALGAGAIPPQYAPLVASVVGVYVACRTLLKAAHALGYAKQIPDLPALPPGSITLTTTPKDPA